MLRNATLNDLPAIVDIYNQTIAGRMVTADLEPVSIESRIPWFHTHSLKRPLQVWEQGNTVIAWLSFKDFYGRPAYRHTAEIAIYIHQQHRGKGLGALLLQQAINCCADLEIHTLLGFIFAHNQPSVSLFRKFGFETWAHLPAVAKLDDELRDLLILGKKI